MNVIKIVLRRWLTVIVVLTPTVALLLIGSFNFKGGSFRNFVGDVLQSLAFLLIGALLIDILFKLADREIEQEQGRAEREQRLADNALLSDAVKTGIERVRFPAREWRPDLEKRRRVAMAGLRIRYFDEPWFTASCEEILNQGGTVTLVMSDPRTPAMSFRYGEEPLPPPYGDDVSGMTGALESAANLIAIAYNWRRRLEDTKGAQAVENLVLKMSSNYPSHSYCLMDDELYVYHYPYKGRGFDGPLFQFSATAPAGRFLLSCLERVVADAVFLDSAVYAGIQNAQRSGELADSKVLGATPTGLTTP